MEDYAVWGIRSAGETGAAIDLACGQATGLRQADRQFVSAALDLFDKGLTPESWTVSTTRSLFYTDYPDSADWRDVWTLGWTLDVRLASGEVSENRFLMPYEWLEPSGGKWGGETQIDETQATALFVAGRRDPSAQPTVGKLVDALEANGLTRIESQPITMKKLDQSRVPLVRVAVNNVDFSKDLQPLNDAVSKLQDSGWFLNWRDFI